MSLVSHVKKKKSRFRTQEGKPKEIRREKWNQSFLPRLLLTLRTHPCPLHRQPLTAPFPEAAPQLSPALRHQIMSQEDARCPSGKTQAAILGAPSWVEMSTNYLNSEPYRRYQQSIVLSPKVQRSSPAPEILPNRQDSKRWLHRQRRTRGRRRRRPRTL